ncbi:MAG TPA: hypothetical protein VI864_07840 [Candidatus Bathyarchaeia archaeon]|nr:hypothetical protein [Candidatus Bathyarchaeia archaeon]
MKAKMLTAAAYPPPPPPSKNSRRLLVVALLLIIIIVSAGVLVYLATSPSSTNPTPNPSATPTATPTATHTSSPSPNVTPTPSGNNQLVNFRAGTWAEYVMKSYNTTSGEVTSENTMKYSVDEDTYSGVACWLLEMEMTMNEDGNTLETVMTYWMNKNNLEGIHVKTQMYMNGNLTYEHEEDIDPGEDPGDMPEPIDLSTVTGHETITVPAGTFYCDKVTVTSATGVTSSWVNSNIPVIGLVKIESRSDGVLTSTTELTGYGG